MWAMLATADPVDQTLHVTLFDVSTGAGRSTLPPKERPDPTLRPYPSYLTPGEELLLTAYGADPLAPAVASWIWRDGAVDVLSRDAGELREVGRPFALAGTGARLLDASTGVNGLLARRSLAGPAAAARCPGAPAATTGNDDDGCQVGPAGDITPWPLLLAALHSYLHRRTLPLPLAAHCTAMLAAQWPASLDGWPAPNTQVRRSGPTGAAMAALRTLSCSSRSVALRGR